MSKLLSSLWRGVSNRRGKNAACSGAETADELTRSQYSLVSSQDLTPEAMRLWLTLPEEVKYDSMLNIFRQQFEKEQSPEKEVKFKQNESQKQKRLHLVSSAPNLEENLHGNANPGQETNKEYQHFLDYGMKEFGNRKFRDKGPDGIDEDRRELGGKTCSVEIVDDFKKGEDCSTLKSGEEL